jgi:protein SDA1
LSKREKKKLKRFNKDLKRSKKKTVASSEDPTVIEERKAKAAAVSLSRILTDKDFAKIDAAQLKKQVDASKARQKRKLADDLDDTIKR